MRSWFFHPILFYPLVALIAALAIAVSAKPLSWPREPAPAATQQAGGTLVLAGNAFSAPAPDPQQNLHIMRTFLGEARTLRIAVLPNQGAPGPDDRGVRILLNREDAAFLNSRPATVLVAYDPLAVNAATGLAVSLEGAGPTQWVTQTASPQPATLRFEVPAQTDVNAIGLRTINGNASRQTEAYGLEITRISVTPHP